MDATGSAEGLSPNAWDSEPERRYARRQAALAGHYDLDVAACTIDTDAAGRIHYLESGDPSDDPVVCLHGQSTTAATWLPMLPALAGDYRLLVPDRPGRGLSACPSYRDRDLRSFMVAYLLELFDALDLDRFHLVANSLGGQQAVLLAADHDRVDRLCLVGAPACLTRDFPLLLRLGSMRGFDRVLDWLVSRGEPLENARAMTERVRVEDTAAIPAAFFELLAASRQQPERQRSLRSMTLAQSSFGRMHPIFDLRDELAGIERPTGFVWGSEDWFWPPAVGRPVADRMADATLHVLEGHGHMPWLEPGEATEGRVRAVLDR